MFCPKCGKELPQDARFCYACGAPLDSGQPPSSPAPENTVNEQTGEHEPVTSATPDIYADTVQTEPLSEPKKTRKKGLALKIIAAVLAAVVLISGMAVLGYYTFLPAKTTLKVAQYYTVQKAWKRLDQSLALSKQQIDTLYSKPMKSDTKISINLDSNMLTSMELDESMAEFVAGIMKDFSIQTSTEVDMSNKRENISVSLNYLENPALTLNLFFDNDRFGFSLPELSEKSITGRVSDLARLEELYPEESAFKGLTSVAGMDPWASTDTIHEFPSESNNFKKLMETYGMFLVNNVDGRNMSIRRGKTVDVMGEELKCQEVTITLDRDEQMELVESLLDTMAEDDLLYDTVFSKFGAIFNTAVAGNPDLARELQSLGMDNLFSRSQIRLMFSSLKSRLNEESFPEEMIIRAYINGLYVVKYEFEVPSEDTDQNFVLSYESLTDESGLRKIGFNVDYSSHFERINAFLNINSDYNAEDNTGYISAEFSVESSGSADLNMLMTFTSNQELESGNTVNGHFEYVLDIDIDDESMSLLVDGNTVQVRNKDGLPESVNVTADVSLDFPSVLPKSIYFTVGSSTETRYGVTVTTPAWAENAIDLGVATREELDEFGRDIEDTIGSLMQMAGYLY
jgi:hypothetical protein